MEFKEALQKSLKLDKRTLTDSFLLHSRVCDLVGNDYEAKRRQRNSTALMPNMKFRKPYLLPRLSDIRNERGIIIKLSRCRCPPIMPTFILQTTRLFFISRANAPAYMMQKEFTAPHTTTRERLLSKRNISRDAPCFLNCRILVASRDCQDYINLISVTVADILSPKQQTEYSMSLPNRYLTAPISIFI